MRTAGTENAWESPNDLLVAAAVPQSAGSTVMGDEADLDVNRSNKERLEQDKQKLPFSAVIVALRRAHSFDAASDEIRSGRRAVQATRIRCRGQRRVGHTASDWAAVQRSLTAGAAACRLVTSESRASAPTARYETAGVNIAQYYRECRLTCSGDIVVWNAKVNLPRRAGDV
jgi:hypothetical protein